MIRHIFLYKLAPDADAEKTIEILNALPGKIEEIRTWTLGRHQGGGGSGRWDCGLVADFDSMDTLKAYNKHPLHMEAVKKLMPMLSAHAVCDFEFDAASQQIR